MGYKFGGQSPRFEEKTRNCKEDSITDHEFEYLYEVAQQLPNKTDSLQSMFILLAAGRLGLRRTEMSHMTEDWVDWDDKMIRIPRHEACGCGNCRQAAKQQLKHHEDMTLEEAMEHRWHPKTEEAIREVPFGFSARIEVVMERFFDRYDEFPHTAMCVNRRVNEMIEECSEVDSLYPHALRATAASYHAGRGLDVTPLQSLMGWADLQTPMRYVKASGKNTSRELERIHNR